MKAYKHLVQYALDHDHCMSVFDGEEWAVRHSTNYEAIIDDIESVEIAELVISNGKGTPQVGWAQIVPFGLEDDETVSDHTITPFMNRWENEYEMLTTPN